MLLLLFLNYARYKRGDAYADYNNLKSIAIYVSVSIIGCYLNIWQYGNSF